MTASFQGNTLIIDDQSIRLAWPVLDAVEEGNIVFVLFDPDSYHLDSSYRKMRRLEAPPILNLVAIARNGVWLWEDELPEHSDYYYRISSSKPLNVNLFASYRCEIGAADGTIIKKEFLK